MIIGVPKEIKNNERRISILPFGVEELKKSNHTILIENNAGVGSGISNQNYLDAGAEIVDSSIDIFNNSDMVVKVKEPQKNELKMIRKGQIIFTYFHFAADKELTNSFLRSGGIAIAYETVQKTDGSLPLLAPMSEVAGRMAVQNGAKCLEGNMGGKGKLLSGVPGVEPANVLILGGGIVGANAAKLAAGLGAKVYILDISPDRLKYLDDIMPANVFTLYSNKHNILELLPKTDLLIGAVLQVGEKAPNLISKKMLKLMQQGSVIVDVAVDQGGCVETCRPTTHGKPTFEIENIIHYCVANMPGSVPHTSTIALANTTFPYLKNIANNGYIEAFKNDISLLKGLNIINGKITHPGVANTFSLNYTNPKKYLTI